MKFAHYHTLPEFALNPKGLANKISKRLGRYKRPDVDFPQAPEFSGKYFLHGSDREAIRLLFTSRVPNFFEHRPGLSVESDGSTLIVYRAGTRMAPNELKAFVRRATVVFKLLKSREIS